MLERARTLDIHERIEQTLRSMGARHITGGIGPRPVPVVVDGVAVSLDHVIHYPDGWRAYWGVRDGRGAYLLIPPEAR